MLGALGPGLNVAPLTLIVSVLKLKLVLALAPREVYRATFGGGSESGHSCLSKRPSLSLIRVNCTTLCLDLQTERVRSGRLDRLVVGD